MLLRVLRRVTTVGGDFEEFFKANFCNGQRFDDELSVYEVDGPGVVQANGEHKASFLGSPMPEGVGAMDLDGVGTATVEASPGTTRFTFTCEQHRNVNFFDEAESRSYAQAAWGDTGGRYLLSSNDQILRYAAGRIRANCEEWKALCLDERRKAWAKAIQTMVAALSKEENAGPDEVSGPTESSPTP